MTESSRLASLWAVESLPGCFLLATRRFRSRLCWVSSNRHNSYDWNFARQNSHGPLDQKWRSHRDHLRLVSPNNRRKFEVIVVGSGLAGGSAAATLGELGYRVKCFCYQDSPRRAHSIAAQGGINAAKNYQNDGDSVFRLFYVTIKGGNFRS